MIFKLMHFPLLFSFLPCIATILHAALFTWHCNVSPTRVIKILCRLWFNTVIICHVRQQKSIPKPRKNKPPRKKKTGKESRVGKGSTQFRSWKAERGRCQRFSRAGGCAAGKLPARGGGDRSKETCCGGLSTGGRGCKQGKESKYAEGIIKPPALTALLAAGHTPHHGRG